MHENEGWAVVIVIAVGAVLLVYAAARTVGQVIALNNLQSMDSPSAREEQTAGWTTYQDNNFHFSVRYPPSWHMITSDLNAETPFVVIGNPPNGTKTYAVQIFIHKNPNALSSGEYVHALLESARAQDVANSASGPAPQIAPRFDKAYVLTVGGYQAYELYNVFAFDHNAERIYIAHGTEVLQFDFPVAQENTNLSLPVANNGIAREIMNTLTFTN